MGSYYAVALMQTVVVAQNGVPLEGRGGGEKRSEPHYKICRHSETNRAVESDSLSFLLSVPLSKKPAFTSWRLH